MLVGMDDRHDLRLTHNGGCGCKASALAREPRIAKCAVGPQLASCRRTAASEPIFGVAAAAAATPLPQPPFSSEGLRRRPTPFSRSQASGSRQFEWTAARRGAPPPPRATATRAVLRSKATATTTRYASSLHVDWWAAWGRHLCGVGLHAALAVLALNSTIETRRRRHDHGHELTIRHTLPPDTHCHPTAALTPSPYYHSHPNRPAGRTATGRYTPGGTFGQRWSGGRRVARSSSRRLALGRQRRRCGWHCAARGRAGSGTTCRASSQQRPRRSERRRPGGEGRKVVWALAPRVGRGG